MTHQLTILNDINLCSHIHKFHKNRILNDLIKLNQNLAPQGSPEWLATRVYNIGGSEMSTITGENCFSSIQQLVAQKIGFSKFSGNVATRWGKLFEVVTQKITEIIFEIDGIKETGSLEGAVPNQRYSPDGLAVIKMKCADYISGNYIETDEYCIVLFEFKSPLYSIPLGYIPKYYAPQVKTGLCSIPITDFAIFISNMFRKCSFDNLGLNTLYDTDFHNRDTKKEFVATNPLSFGLILIYQTESQRTKFYEKYNSLILQTSDNMDNNSYTNNDSYDSYDSDDSDDTDDTQNIFNNIENSKGLKSNISFDENELFKYIYNIKDQKYTRDFGKSKYKDFDNILQLFDDGLLSMEYCTPHILSEYNTNIFLKAQNLNPGNNNIEETINKYNKIIQNRLTTSNNNIIGYLPWKMFKSDILIEHREEFYVHKHETKIQETIAIIKKINEQALESEKILLFKKYFPKSRILKDEGLDNNHIMEFLPHNM